jgi:hypothetical protein
MRADVEWVLGEASAHEDGSDGRVAGLLHRLDDLARLIGERLEGRRAGGM